MKLNRTGSVWDRNERIKINDNWDIIDEILISNGESFFNSESFNEWLNKNNFKHKEAVQKITDLPENPEDNEVRGVKDTNEIYIYNGQKWVLITSFDMSEVQDIKQSINKTENDLSKIFGLRDTGKFIYVDNKISVSGDGTEQSPFKTIQEAFNSIPKIIDKRHTIMIAPGDYDEEAYLTGVIGGTIFVRSLIEPSTVEEVNVRVKALNFYDIVGYVHIENLGTLGGNLERKAFILFSRCIYGSLSRLLIDRAMPGKITLYWDGSFGSLGTSYIANQELCIQSQNGSTVRVDSTNTSGGGNETVLYSLNGFIFKNGSQNWINNATVPEKTEAGGKIYGDNSWIEIPLKNGWANNSGVNLKVKDMGNGFAYIYGWVNKSPLDKTVIATLPSGLRPINTQRHYVSVTGTAGVQTSPPVLSILSNGDILLVNEGTLPPNNGLALNIIMPIV